MCSLFDMTYLICNFISDSYHKYNVYDHDWYASVINKSHELSVCQQIIELCKIRDYMPTTNVGDNENMFIMLLESLCTDLLHIVLRFV